MKEQPLLLKVLGYLATLVVLPILVNIVSNWITSQKSPIILHFVGFQISIGVSLLLTVIILVLMYISYKQGFKFCMYMILKEYNHNVKTPFPQLIMWWVFLVPIWLPMRLMKIFSNQEQKIETDDFGSMIRNLVKEQGSDEPRTN